MGVNSRPTVPEAVNIGDCWGPSRPKSRTKAYRSRPKARWEWPTFAKATVGRRTPKVFASRWRNLKP